jgi:Fe/S biogenesis protein nfuA
MDGGDIEFINFKDGILKLRFKGECAHCELSHITMKFAIEKNILEKIPEVKKVTEVKMSVI